MVVQRGNLILGFPTFILFAAQHSTALLTFRRFDLTRESVFLKSVPQECSPRFFPESVPRIIPSSYRVITTHERRKTSQLGGNVASELPLRYAQLPHRNTQTSTSSGDIPGMIE
ncbi:hypothetical protein F4810DRAFT_225776 [Camillea tinctor]|nr:hypothetical protein F4810DRAFT_225776 [Camillea tinctor]